MKRLLFAMMLSLPFVITSCQENEGIPNDENSSVNNARKDIVLSRTEQQLLDENVKFAFSFFNKMNEQETEKANWLISPLSASIALSMTANGADDTSLNQIQNVLGFKGFQMEEINSFYNRIIGELMALDNTTKFNLANSVWLHNDFNVYDSFVNINKEKYDAEVTSLDLSSPLALETINDWSAKQTEDLIPVIIDKLPEDMIFCILNSLYFKGGWESEFKESATVDELFTCADGKQSKVKMMRQKKVFWSCVNDNFKLAEFPYGNSAFSMVVLLPNEESTLEESLQAFTAEYWTESMQMKGKELDVHFPRFELKYEADLINVMKSLGITDIFDSESANLSKMTPDDIYVNLLKQSAYIKTDEKGTEAAATTIVGGNIALAPPTTFEKIDFNMNRPFAFLIKEKSTGIILFMGKVTEL